MEKLKPCPFCGLVPEIEDHSNQAAYGCDPDYWWLECKNKSCPALKVSVPAGCKKDVIRAWNTRPLEGGGKA